MKKLFMILILQVFIIGGFYSNSFAVPITRDGNTYLKSCKLSLKLFEGGHLKPQELITSGECINYITGYVDAHNFETNGTPFEWYCLPPTGTYGQYIRIFVKFMEKHPERLHEDVAVLLYSALKIEFPCKKQSP